MQTSRFVYRLSLFLFVCGLSPSAHSAIALGTGFSSTTSGRQIPTIAGAVDFSSWTVSGFATGVATPVYSQSGYLLSLTTEFVKGSFLGDFEAKAGGGLYYSKRTLRDSPTSTLQAEDSFAVGPSFRTIWRPFSPMYLGFDVLVGLRPSTAHLGIAIQDVVSMSIGFEL